MSERRISGTSFLVVAVRDPDAYLARLGRLARPAARASLRLVGSPVTIASVGLETGFRDLSTLIRDGFERFHLRTPGT